MTVIHSDSFAKDKRILRCFQKIMFKSHFVSCYTVHFRHFMTFLNWFLSSSKGKNKKTKHRAKPEKKKIQLWPLECFKYHRNATLSSRAYLSISWKINIFCKRSALNKMCWINLRQLLLFEYLNSFDIHRKYSRKFSKNQNRCV